MIFDEENVTRITVGTPICTIIVLLLCTCAFAARYRTPGFDSAWKAVELSADIPAGGEKVWILPALPQRSDMVAVIRFHAVLKAQEGAMSSHENTNIDPAQRMVFQGSKNFLSMKWNGSPVLANIGNLPSGLPRLLNYSMRNFLTDSETADSYFKENRLAVPLAGMPAAKNRDADEVGWYMIEVSDLVSSAKTGTLAENKLVLGNTSHAGAMEISSVEAGCLPAKVVAEFPMRARLSNSAEQINPKAVLKGKGFAVALASAGGLVLNHAGESDSVDSGFSYPYMPNDGWNSLSVSNTPSRTSEWKITAETSKDALSITGTGKHYRLVRRVFVVGDHAVVEDTLTNLTSEPLGIAFDNRVTPTGVPRAINVCGPYKKTYMPYNPSNQVGNLTIYLAGEKQGLGMLAVDDYYQLQLTMLAEGKTGVFRNVNFGLPGKDSYTFKWALYPTEKSDYYEFINKARRDLLPPRTIEGSVAMFCYSLALDWPKKKVADWLKQRVQRLSFSSARTAVVRGWARIPTTYTRSRTSRSRSTSPLSRRLFKRSNPSIPASSALRLSRRRSAPTWPRATSRQNSPTVPPSCRTASRAATACRPKPPRGRHSRRRTRTSSSTIGRPPTPTMLGARSGSSVP